MLQNKEGKLSIGAQGRGPVVANGGIHEGRPEQGVRQKLGTVLGGDMVFCSSPMEKTRHSLIGHESPRRSRSASRMSDPLKESSKRRSLQNRDVQLKKTYTSNGKGTEE